MIRIGLIPVEETEKKTVPKGKKAEAPKNAPAKSDKGTEDTEKEADVNA